MQKTKATDQKILKMHKKVFEKAMIDMQKRITELTQQLKEKETEIKLQAQKIRDILSLDKN